MKSLGEKDKNIYDSPTSPEAQKNKIRYPEVSLPLSVVEGLGLDLDDEVEIKLKGRVCGIENTKWSQRITFEAKEGEVAKTEAAKSKSILEAAGGPISGGVDNLRTTIVEV